MVLRITNKDTRRIWLSLQGMLAMPAGIKTRASLSGIIEQLGMVQLDPLRVVARAHDHILWSRTPNYRPEMLENLLSKDRLIFEHFTHDAVVLPLSVWPKWTRQRTRKCEQMEKGSWGTPLPPANHRQNILKRIADEGPLTSRDFDSKPQGETWRRSAHRVSLDYLWHSGKLATAARPNFSKVFDLTERVIPAEILSIPSLEDDEQISWLCRSALARLGFGTQREIKAFYDAADLIEVRAFANNTDWWQPAEIELADGSWYPVLARTDIRALISATETPSLRMRIVNPFDPIVRDRDRAKRLFGFDYRIEIYTPAAKRQYGYYVYPLLEGDRFVGRIEVQADRKTDTLHIRRLWPERGVVFGKGRLARLEAELKRLSQLSGTPTLHYHQDYLQ